MSGRPAYPDNTTDHVRDLEELRTWFINALEVGASMAELQISMGDDGDPLTILRETRSRLQPLFDFEMLGFACVDETDQSFDLCEVYPVSRRSYIQAEIDDQIEQGTFAWALTQTRSILGRSHDKRYTVVLHVLATRSRIRGMFLGFLNRPISEVRDSLLHVLSMILYNTANALGSQELYRLINEQNRNLERVVEQRTAELEKARQQAEAANQAKSQFIANMSHEMRTPLTSIIGFADVLQDDGLDERERRKALATIVRTGRHLGEIINDILDLSKLETHNLYIERIPASLFETVARVESVIEMQAREKGLAFMVDYRWPLPERITTDPTRLMQILLNLCSNAVKFTEQGRIELAIECVPEREQLSISVTDTGIGLSEEQRAGLFRSFTQADPSTTRKYGGTGLGLYISRQLAEMLGGTITVQSSPGAGSRFTATIATGALEGVPMLHRVAHLKPVDAAEEVARLQRDTTGTILLAEDDPDVQRLIALYLRETNIDIDMVDNGRAAVERALAGDYDFLLTDLQMPELGGLEVVQWLRTAGYRRPIVVLTASAVQDEKNWCTAAGCNAFLTKPVDREAFFRVIEEHLGDAANQRLKQFQDEERLRADPEYQAARNDFVAGLRHMLGSFSGRLGSVEWDALRATAHRLKGSAGGYGFAELGAAAARIEAAIVEGRLSAVPRLIEALEREAEAVLQSAESGRRCPARGMPKGRVNEV